MQFALRPALRLPDAIPSRRRAVIGPCGAPAKTVVERRDRVQRRLVKSASRAGRLRSPPRPVLCRAKTKPAAVLCPNPNPEAQRSIRGGREKLHRFSSWRRSWVLHGFPRGAPGHFGYANSPARANLRVCAARTLCDVGGGGLDAAGLVLGNHRKGLRHQAGGARARCGRHDRYALVRQGQETRVRLCAPWRIPKRESPLREEGKR
eukprot:scaffold8184_cov258-Pinguiococcus_pyrenoidosus.AAC.5